MASKAKMFNREAANPKNKPEEILKILALQQGEKIADIGAGGGYFSLRFAEAVGKQGAVYAVDTDSGKIEFIRKSVGEKGLGNIQVVLAGKESARAMGAFEPNQEITICLSADTQVKMSGNRYE